MSCMLRKNDLIKLMPNFKTKLAIYPPCHLCYHFPLHCSMWCTLTQQTFTLRLTDMHTHRLKIAPLPFCTLSCWETHLLPRWSPAHCCWSAPWSTKSATGNVRFSYCGQNGYQHMVLQKNNGVWTWHACQEQCDLHDQWSWSFFHITGICTWKQMCREPRMFTFHHKVLTRTFFRREAADFTWQPLQCDSSPNGPKVQLAKEWLGPWVLPLLRCALCTQNQ